jgi:pimeloyl-ACP methyl ester carboxylesterase
MALATNNLISAGGHGEVVLIGYSGGGALARLMAPEIHNLIGILTVSANLDTEAWRAAHGYLPLVRSINPADARPLPEDIVHVAVVGDRDVNVPPSVADAYVAAGQRAEVWRYADADHACCWHGRWAEILARFEDRLAVRQP